MFSKVFFVLIALGATLGHAGNAVGQDKVHGCLSETALEVKAAESPSAKRAILNGDLGKVREALSRTEASPLTSAQDHPVLERLRFALQAKSDELVGANGFERVSDSERDTFSTYVVQDME